VSTAVLLYTLHNLVAAAAYPVGRLGDRGAKMRVLLAGYGLGAAGPPACRAAFAACGAGRAVSRPVHSGSSRRGRWGQYFFHLTPPEQVR
jgi:hypothetical protein